MNRPLVQALIIMSLIGLLFCFVALISNFESDTEMRRAAEIRHNMGSLKDI